MPGTYFNPVQTSCSGRVIKCVQPPEKTVLLRQKEGPKLFSSFFCLACNLYLPPPFYLYPFETKTHKPATAMTDIDYNECVNLYADNVYRFILKSIRHTEDAQDVVQSAFEKLWINRAQVEAEKAKSYLFTIAYHQMIDNLRKVKRMHYKEELPEQAAGITLQPQRHLKKQLEAALATLNETQRTLVMLKDYEGYSYEEIGEITSLNTSQVKVYLHRARIALRNYLVRLENVV